MKLHGCSSCGGPRDRRSQRYCKSCHAAYQRDWRAEQALKLRKYRRLEANVAREMLSQVGLA